MACFSSISAQLSLGMVARSSSYSSSSLRRRPVLGGSSKSGVTSAVPSTTPVRGGASTTCANVISDNNVVIVHTRRRALSSSSSSSNSNSTSRRVVSVRASGEDAKVSSDADAFDPPWSAPGYRGAAVSSLPEPQQAAAVLTAWAGIAALTYASCHVVGPAVSDAFPGYMAWSRSTWPVLGKA